MPDLGETVADGARGAVLRGRCGSPMCEYPHRHIFGRCACALWSGHVGPHLCESAFRATPEGRYERRSHGWRHDFWTGLDALEGWLQDHAAWIPWFFFAVGVGVGWLL